jgi:hypothetical protein
MNPTGKKSYDLAWIDTMKIWAFNEWNYKCSLDRLCFVLGVQSPKGEMNGAMVKDLFYNTGAPEDSLPFDGEEERFAEIAKYQGGDIVALVNCFLRLNNEPIIPEDKIKYV